MTWGYTMNAFKYIFFKRPFGTDDGCWSKHMLRTCTTCNSVGFELKSLFLWPCRQLAYQNNSLTRFDNWMSMDRSLNDHYPLTRPVGTMPEMDPFGHPWWILFDGCPLAPLIHVLVGCMRAAIPHGSYLMIDTSQGVNVSNLSNDPFE